MWTEIWGAIQPILTALGSFAAVGGGLVAIAYGVFKSFGEKWLNAKFEERLAVYKHEQQRELEQLRYKINTLMDRTVKLHQREFDVLPEAWGRLTDAFHATHPIGLGFHQYPDVNKLTADQLDDLLDERSPLAGWQKTELRSASDKTRYYADAISWHNLLKAEGALRDFHIYFSKNGIFVPDDIKTKFVDLDDLMNGAVTERRFAMQYRDMPPKFEAGQLLHTEGQERLKFLEKDVQRQLWSSQATNV